MCFGGGDAPAPAPKPIQPYRTDVDVQAYYNSPTGTRTAPTPKPVDPNAPKLTGIQALLAGIIGGSTQGEPGIVRKSDITATDDKTWNNWEAAYYNYQKAKTKKEFDAQAKQQTDYMALQEKMGRDQMAMQEKLQNEQLASQKNLSDLQASMQAQQIAQQRDMQAQEAQFAKDSSVMQKDNKRAVDMVTKQTKEQTNFVAGKASSKAKNSGAVMSSRGTKALQVGLGTPSSGAAGLSIPV